MTQKYQVKVSMKQAAIVKTGIVLKQGDFGMQIEIEVLDFDVTGTTPQIVFRKAMGAVESTTITVSGNKYTYTFKGTELDTPGKVICDLKLKNSTTQRISSASFSFEVVADTLDGLAEESSSYSDTIEQIVSGIDSKFDDLKKIKKADTRADDALVDIINNNQTAIPFTWENGHINATTGQDMPGNNNQRAISYIKLFGKNVKVRSTGNVAVYLYEYDNDLTFLEVHGTYANYISPVNQNTAFIRVSTYSTSIPQETLHTYIEGYWINNENIDYIRSSISTINSNITAINNNVTSINSNYSIQTNDTDKLELIVNGISGSGTFDGATKRATTKKTLRAPFILCVANGYNVWHIAKYSMDGAFIGFTEEITRILYVTDTNYLYRVLIHKGDNETISKEELPNIVELFLQSNNINEYISIRNQDILSNGISDDFVRYPLIIAANGSMAKALLTYGCWVFPVKAGDVVRFKGAANVNDLIGFLKSFNYFPVIGSETADFSDTTDGLFSANANLETVFIIPYDCKYFYVRLQYIPLILEINGKDYLNGSKHSNLTKSTYISLPLYGFENTSSNTVKSSMMKFPVVGGTYVNTVQCPKEYDMQIEYTTTDLQTTVTSNRTGTGGHPGNRGDLYTNYRVAIRKKDDSAITASEVKTLVDEGKIILITTQTDDNIIDLNQDIYNDIKALSMGIIDTGETIPRISKTDKNPLFIHISDVHGDVKRLERAYEYAEHVGADMLINTGDTVIENISNGAAYAFDIASQHSLVTLNTIGNHDAAETYSEIEIYNKNISSYKNKYGYETNAKPYYYYDDTQNNIRFISLCFFLSSGSTPAIDQNQIDWFISTLKGTPENYAIVILEHAPLQELAQIEFINDYTQTDIFYPWYGAYPSIGDLITNIIDAFVRRTTVNITRTISGNSITASDDFANIDESIEFICYLNGHTHMDGVGYYKNTLTKQAFITTDCGVCHAGDANTYTYAFCSELPRTYLGRTQDCFNVFSFDRRAGIIKISKVGSNMTMTMKKRNSISFKYKNII